MMYRCCCLNEVRVHRERRSRATQLSFCSCLFLSSEQMRVSIYRDKYIKISHLFIIFFSNHVHVCFKPLPSGRKEVLWKTYSQSSLGSWTHNPRAMARLQEADTVEQHGEKGPSGHWGIWSHSLHCSTLCCCSCGSLRGWCSGHL